MDSMGNPGIGDGGIEVVVVEVVAVEFVVVVLVARMKTAASVPAVAGMRVCLHLLPSQKSANPRCVRPL